MKLQLVHMRARLNTKSQYILCTVYGMCVCVFVHTRLSSKP